MASLAALFAESDKLFETSEIKDNYDLTKKALLDGSKGRDPGVMWRHARSVYELVEGTPGIKGELPLVEEGLAPVTSLVRSSTTLPQPYLYHGALMGKKGDLVSAKEKVSYADGIRESFNKAIALDPRYGAAYYALGKYHYSVLNCSWLERQAANLLGWLPQASWEEAYTNAKKANEFYPNRIYIQSLLGATAAELNRKDEAKAAYAAAAAFPAKTPRQVLQKQDAERQLRKL